MQILGHKLIDYKALKSISSADEISEAKDLTLLFEYDPDLILQVKSLKKEFALHVFNQTEAIIGNATGASILICPEKLALDVQKLAEYYLFDAKVALLINSEDEIEKAIELKLDMAILPDAII